MLNCKQVTELCSAELERRLDWKERFALRTHLMMCSGCTNYRKQMALLRRAATLYREGRAESGDE